MLNVLDPTLKFEQGPIRPPNEAKSLLLRFSRNCPWNKCKFCPVYKEKKFSRRTIREIKADIDIIAVMRDQIKALSWKLGQHGKIEITTIKEIFSNYKISDSFYNVASWLFYNTGNVFLQDANNLVLEPSFFIEALTYLRQRLPEVKRITTYARSSNAARLSINELILIKKGGLDRIHIGMETALDPLLNFMKKGVTADKQIEAGKKIKAAGLELSEYVMPGLGGQKWSREHAIHTAQALNQINPDFIRLRTLRIPKSVELYHDLESNEFTKLSEDQIIEEIQLFITELDNITSYITSDHNMNLIETIEGYISTDKKSMLKILNEYLTLSERARLIYRFCRRMGHCREPKDLQQLKLMEKIELALTQIEKTHNDPEQILLKMANF